MSHLTRGEWIVLPATSIVRKVYADVWRIFSLHRTPGLGFGRVPLPLPRPGVRYNTPTASNNKDVIPFIQLLFYIFKKDFKLCLFSLLRLSSPTRTISLFLLGL